MELCKGEMEGLGTGALELEPLAHCKGETKGLGPGTGAWGLGPLWLTVQVRRSCVRSPDGALSRIDVEMKRNTFRSAKTTNPLNLSLHGPTT